MYTQLYRMVIRNKYMVAELSKKNEQTYSNGLKLPSGGALHVDWLSAGVVLHI